MQGELINRDQIKEKVNQLFDKYDNDKNGCLSKEEFIEGCTENEDFIKYINVWQF